MTRYKKPGIVRARGNLTDKQEQGRSMRLWAQRQLFSRFCLSSQQYKTLLILSRSASVTTRGKFSIKPQKVSRALRMYECNLVSCVMWKANCENHRWLWSMLAINSIINFNTLWSVADESDEFVISFPFNRVCSKADEQRPDYDGLNFVCRPCKRELMYRIKRISRRLPCPAGRLN